MPPWNNSGSGQLTLAWHVQYPLNHRNQHDVWLPFPIHSFLKPNLIMLGTILLIVLVLMLLGTIPTWPHSRNWGYGPSGGVGLIVIILLILVLMGRI